MTKLVKVSAHGNGIEWKEALKTVKPDDVLLLEPGYYVLPQGLDVVDLTIKGTGSSPDDTVIEGYFVLGPDCNFFTLENLAVETKSNNNSFFVEDSADTYLTLRNAVIRSGKDDTAAIAVNGKCTLELFSVKILGASISLFKNADFRLTMNDSIVDYKSSNYSAIGIQGKGTAIISNSKILGSISTYPGSNSELDLNNSMAQMALIHGATWMNMLNSQITSHDDSSLYISDESWVNIVRCKFEGGVFLDKNTRTIIQNSQMDRLIVCDTATITMINCSVLSHADFQDEAIADAERTAFSGTGEFEYFLALNKNARLEGKDLIFNPNESVLAVKDDAQVKLNVLVSSDKNLEVECLKKPNVKILGMRWKAKKSDK